MANINTTRVKGDFRREYTHGASFAISLSARSVEYMRYRHPTVLADSESIAVRRGGLLTPCEYHGCESYDSEARDLCLGKNTYRKVMMFRHFSKAGLLV